MFFVFFFIEDKTLISLTLDQDNGNDFFFLVVSVVWIKITEILSMYKHDRIFSSVTTRTRYYISSPESTNVKFHVFSCKLSNWCYSVIFIITTIAMASNMFKVLALIPLLQCACYGALIDIGVKVNVSANLCLSSSKKVDVLTTLITK